MVTTMKKTTLQIQTAQLEQLIAQALNVLKKDRDRIVVARRHGIAGEEVATLERIGQQLGITRERVRQIEKAALTRMRTNKQPDSVLNEAVAQLLTEIGGIIAFDDLLNQLQVESKDAPSVSFLLKLNPDIEVLGENDDHSMLIITAKNYTPKDIQSLHRAMIEIAKKQGRPIRFENIAKHIDGVHSEQSLLQLGHASKVLVDFEGRWGLMSWPEVNPRSIRDKAYIVLKQSGRPMHFSEIAKAVTQLKPNTKQVTTQAVHNELIKDDRFILIGRGIYALRQWGYTPGTVADIISEILSEQSPLGKDEIVRRVLLKRQVKPTTIILNLQEKPQFERVGKATYRLKNIQ